MFNLIFIYIIFDIFIIYILTFCNKNTTRKYVRKTTQALQYIYFRERENRINTFI